MKLSADLKRCSRPWICLLHLLFLSVALTSCLITYKEIPKADESGRVSAKNVRLHYYVDSFDLYSKALARVGAGFDFPYPARDNYRELERAIAESHLFSETVRSPTPPQHGIHCSVDVKHIPPSKPAEAVAFVSALTLTAIPSYSESSADLVRFALSIDGELKKVYEYQVTRIKGTWIVFLPVAWINLFTPTRTEAFRAVVHQFFLDADRDGYFKPSGL
jgi:hypothetical protein